MSLLELGLLITLAAAGLASLGVAAAREDRHARARIAFFSGAAREAGLSDIQSERFDVVARSGALRVRLSDYSENEVSGTRVTISGRRLAPGLTLRFEGLATLFSLRNKTEVEVGDEDFDKEVSVQGPPALALALLDHDMRRCVRTLLHGRLEVRGHRPLWVSGRLVDGVLWVNLPQESPAARGTRAERREHHDAAGETYLDGEYKLPQVLRAALDLAARLVAPDDLARRIASRLAQEPEPGVRRRALLALLREFPEHAATRETLVAARADEDAEVRVRAGMALGAEGHDVLFGIAGGEGAEDATSARAVAGLGSSLTLEKAAELLKNALRTRRLLTASTCLGTLGHHGAAAVPILARVLLVERGELGEAAAEALAATGDASAEAPLVRALSEEPAELRRAAAAALGRVGTRDAVVHLREAESRETALRGVARQAIAQIHARLAGAAQGQLSLAGGESGQLSLAEDESGRLSLSQRPEKKADAPGGRGQVSN